jgi:hypothetical protein
MSSVAIPAEAAAVPRPSRRFSFRTRLALYGEVVRGGLIEVWAHKLRSTLTLTLLMLGVFALVVMTSVLDGVMDKVSMGFSGMSWDGTLRLVPKSPETTEEQKRFAMSPGLRFEDLPRVAAPHEKVLAFIPRAYKRSAVRITGDNERIYVNGVSWDNGMWMNRTIGLGRGLTDDNESRSAETSRSRGSRAGASACTPRARSSRMRTGWTPTEFRSPFRPTWTGWTRRTRSRRSP